ncbi:MAG: Putative transmembrane transport protein [Ktedonobacterales bacterium]|jgi:hypothetical protein|nr:MAG: Putative transmembrane transport protein [Ktedonobacterales bacterium]
MIWLTWRQHRAAAYLFGGVFALLVVIVLITGHNIATLYQQLGVANCIAHPDRPNCDNVLGGFLDQVDPWVSALQWLNLLPALIGVLIGAPLVAHELEQGTHRLVWTQSVSRMRWLAVKLVALFGAVLLATALFTVLTTWWFTPLYTIRGNFIPSVFDFEGGVPLAYAAFALALGIAAGALLRRTIPAMVVTIADFLAVRLPVEFFLRPRYLPPLHTTTDALAMLGPQSASAFNTWQVDSGWADHLGQHISDVTVNQTCGDVQTKMQAFQCIHDHGIFFLSVYQPGDRLDLFQGIETAIFAALALALVALTIWWVRRRIS